MGFGRTRVELDHLLIKLCCLIELLVPQRHLSSRGKFSEILGLRRLGRHKTQAAEKQYSDGQ
jgi:hypothetical protein